MATRSPRMYSHKKIDDHRKKEKTTHKNTNKQKGKLEQKMIYHTLTYKLKTQDA